MRVLSPIRKMVQHIETIINIFEQFSKILLLNFLVHLFPARPYPKTLDNVILLC